MITAIYDTYNLMCTAAAEASIKLFNQINDVLVCPASGDTPSGLFREWVRRGKAGDFDATKLSFVGLDEWMGMNGQDEGSCREYLDRQLFQPLEVANERICFFDGRSQDPEAECGKTEQFITAGNGIDLCILGLGQNGHIGMNEPGVDPGRSSHIATISAETAAVGQKYFSSNKKLEQGLTLGVSSILASKEIYLLVSGEKKAKAVKQLIESEITNSFPASFLKTHSNCTVYLDKDAAKLITQNDK